METRPSKAPNGNILPFTLALVLVAGFLFFIGKIVWYDPQDLDLLKTLSAIFLGPIGTILGFYFGNRPVERLTLRVQELIEANKDMLHQVEEKKAELEKERYEATMTVRELKENLEKTESIIQRIDDYVKK